MKTLFPQDSQSKLKFEGRYRGAPVTDVDPFCISFLDDPYSRYEQMREAGPVIWLERYNCWAATRQQEVSSILADPQTFCSSRGVGLADFAKLKQYWRTPSILLEADPPDHTAIRGFLSRLLSAPNVAKLRDGFVAVAERMIEELLARGSFDAITDLAEAFPLSVVPDAFGLAKEGREHLLPFGSLVFTTFGPENALYRDALAAAKPHVQWVAEQCRRENLRDHSIGADVYAAADRGEITTDQAGMLIRALLSAGLDTTVNAIGAAVLCLAQFPSEWKKLRADPKLSRAAFEEAIRLEAPVQVFFRTTTRAVTVGGIGLEEGEKVLMFLGSANRDSQRWEKPDQYDITRKTAGHVGFGHGIHMCVGQFLSRLEGEVILGEIAKRVGHIQITGEPRRRYNNTLRGLDSLPVTFFRPD